MCKCDPNSRTPFCGKIGCEWPDQETKSEDGFGKELDRLFCEFMDALKEDNINKASIAMNAIWVMFQILATSATTELKELTYLKTPFTFDNGGKYVLMLMHIDGPKIKLREDSGTGYTKKFEEVK